MSVNKFSYCLKTFSPFRVFTTAGYVFQERREVFMKQLMPTSTPLCRVKIKLFGHSGSGKSTLADSLKCGYFGSFFRKARLSSSTSVATDGGVTKNNGKDQALFKLSFNIKV